MFDILRKRLNVFGGDLNLMIVSLQREDFIAFRKVIDEMDLGNLQDIKINGVRLVPHEVHYNDTLFKAALKENLSVAYKFYFNLMQMEDLHYIYHTIDRKMKMKELLSLSPVKFPNH